MKVTELQNLIREEVIKVVNLEVTKAVKLELPKIIKPLVQEAVAGALANLLAEGIVNGPPVSKPKILTPDIPQARGLNQPASRPARQAAGLDAFAKRSLAEKAGYGSIDSIGINVSSGNIVNDILAETAMEMKGTIDEGVKSVLDISDDDLQTVEPEAVEAITRNYSELMKRMESRGMLRG